MNISSFRYHPKIIFPTFTSNADFYRLPGGKEIGNNSWMFRDGINWRAFAEYQFQNFKDKDHVRVVQIGSSDGSEAFSYIISLIESNSELAEKFLPMLGYDIDRNIINRANSGILNLGKRDIDYFSSVNLDYTKYFTPTDENVRKTGFNILSNESYQPHKVSELLQKRVIFEHGDMFNVIKFLKDDSNTVLLCRNVMIYLDEILNQHFISMVGQKLKSGSLFAIGKLDSELPYIEEALRNSGFEKVLNNIYRKI